MARISQRTAGSIFLLLAGSGSFLYGSLFHTVTVQQPKTEEVRVAIAAPLNSAAPADTPSAAEDARPGPSEDAAGRPAAKAPPPGDPKADDADNPFEVPAARRGGKASASENPFEPPPDPDPPLAPPELQFETITQTSLVAQDDPERAIVRDVTVGGVVRLANGQLQRTYSGKPPALCPT